MIYVETNVDCGLVLRAKRTAVDSHLVDICIP
jgi:hypothetical protein